MDESEALIIVLNGAPRSGKSAISLALLARRTSWVADGVDSDMSNTPPHLMPGIGLRPGGERSDLEEAVRRRYVEMFRRCVIAATPGRSVVLDLGLHHDYAGELYPLWDAATHLPHASTWLVGVRCDLSVIMQRRAQSRPDIYLPARDGEVPFPVLRWQEAVHDPGIYDLEVDTSRTPAGTCAERILAAIATSEPNALRSVAERERPTG